MDQMVYLGMEWVVWEGEAKEFDELAERWFDPNNIHRGFDRVFILDGDWGRGLRRVGEGAETARWVNEGDVLLRTPDGEFHHYTRDIFDAVYAELAQRTLRIFEDVGRGYHRIDGAYRIKNLDYDGRSRATLESCESGDVIVARISLNDSDLTTLAGSFTKVIDLHVTTKYEDGMFYHTTITGLGSKRLGATGVKDLKQQGVH